MVKKPGAAAEKGQRQRNSVKVLNAPVNGLGFMPYHMSRSLLVCLPDDDATSAGPKWNTRARLRQLVGHPEVLLLAIVASPNAAQLSDIMAHLRC